MTDTTDGRIRTDVEGAIGHLVIDNPERRNAIGLSMYRAIPGAVTSLVDAGVRVIVVTGAGTNVFCSGSDVSEFATLRTPDNWRDYATAEHHAHEALRSAPMPTVAAIHGPCRGGGLALALCADLRYAADDATFAVPPGKLGIGYPPDGLEVLSVAVGLAAAKELALTARVVGAAEAVSLGLVTRAVPADLLDEVIDSVTADITGLAPLTLRAAKFALTDYGRSPADRSPETVEALQAACYASDDYVEGVRAFADKRVPEFHGH